MSLPVRGGKRVYYDKWADRHKPARKSGQAGTWSDVEIEFIVAACKTTKSFGVIAREFNESFPDNRKTRNAIIGKCGREGLVDTKPKSTGQAAKAIRRMSKNRVVRAIPAKRSPRVVAKMSKKDLAPVVFKDGPELRSDEHSHIRRGGSYMARRTPKQIAEARKGYLPSIIEEQPLTSVAMGQTADDCCKWPTSEDITCMEVCGEPAEYGAYCKRHAMVAYREMPTRRRNNGYARKGMMDDQLRQRQRDERMLEEYECEAPLLGADPAPLMIPHFADEPS